MSLTFYILIVPIVMSHSYLCGDSGTSIVIDQVSSWSCVLLGLVA